MKATPKFTITSKKFGVSIYPKKYYPISRAKNGQVRVNINETVSIVVPLNKLTLSGGKPGGGVWQGNKN